MSRLDAAGYAGQAGTGPYFMGTKKTVMDFFPPVEEGSPGPNYQEMEADETLGTRFPTDREVGGIYYEPSLSGKVRANWLPALLSSFLCDPVSAPVVGATGAFEHVLDPTLPGAAPRAASILLHRGDPDPTITDLFWDALGQDLTLSVEPNDWLSFESSFVARAMDDSQPAPTVVADLTRRFPFYSVCAFAAINGGEEVALPLSAFSMDWSSNIDTDAWALCQRGLWRVAPGNVDCGVTFTALDDLRDWYRRVFLTTPEPVALRLLATGPLIASTQHYEVEVTIHRAIETEAEADVNAAEVLLGVPVTSQAALDPSTGKFITVRVVNTIEEYFA